VSTRVREARLMCIKKKVFLNLCELYPDTAENLRIRGLERRYQFIKKMNEYDNVSPNKFKALKRSFRKKLEQ